MKTSLAKINKNAKMFEKAIDVRRSESSFGLITRRISSTYDTYDRLL